MLIYSTKLQIFLLLFLQSFNAEPTKDELLENANNLFLEMQNIWIIFSSVLVFFMQAGFAMLEMGSVRSKNSMNILLKNVIDIIITTLVWFSIGHALAQGGDNKFMGTTQFLGIDTHTPNQPRNWTFNWAFAGTAATIVSGCLAERCYISVYIAISVVLAGFVQPLVVHWTWAEGGWLKERGQMDAAGSGVVHLLGGTSGLIGTLFLGPRAGRFDENVRLREFKPHNVGMVALGTLLLWFGWFGFNGGSVWKPNLKADQVMQLIENAGMSTTISASAGGLTVLLLGLIQENVQSVTLLSNGLLAGLVAITASCDVANHWSSFIIGMLAGVAQQVSSQLVKYLEIDDPLDAFSIHGSCGLLGLIVSGSIRGSWLNFTGCLIGAVVIILWTSFWSILIQGLFSKLNILRVSEEVEKIGLDRQLHGGLSQQISASKNQTDNSSTLKKPKEHTFLPINK